MFFVLSQQHWIVKRDFQLCSMIAERLSVRLYFRSRSQLQDFSQFILIRNKVVSYHWNINIENKVCVYMTCSLKSVVSVSRVEMIPFSRNIMQDTWRFTLSKTRKGSYHGETKCIPVKIMIHYLIHIPPLRIGETLKTCHTRKRTWSWMSQEGRN